MSKQTMESLRRLEQTLRARVRGLMARQPAGGALRSVHRRLSAVLGVEVAVDEFVDWYAQTLLCAWWALRAARALKIPSWVIAWIRRQAHPLWRGALDECLSAEGERGRRPRAEPLLRGSDLRPLDGLIEELTRRHDGDEMLTHFYEQFLEHCDRKSRERNGVFYTPRSVASYMVRRVDELLREEFGLDGGLGDVATWREMSRRHPDLQLPAERNVRGPFVRILDPAAGSGVFLVEVIRLVHRTMTARWRAAGCSRRRVSELWNQYVPAHLLPRMVGLELLLPACVMASFCLARALWETGFHFRKPGRFRVYPTNSLAGPEDLYRAAAPSGASARQRAVPVQRAEHQLPFTVLLGNPPYSAASNNRHPWIEDLMRGRAAGHSGSASYYRLDGRALGERKLWLHDDYVKFIRYGQWRIETTGCGVLAFVTNHGYLDNVTFRGMRQQLLRAFPRITVVDLHGNRKKRERRPDGQPDENLFEVEQGMSIGLFRRPIGQPADPQLEYAELWGTRSEKHEALAGAAHQGRPAELVKPGPPFYFFVPRRDSLRAEYERGWRLTDLMPVHTTAVVTARDGLVVALDRHELLDRMRQFRDAAIADDVICARYLTKGRSARYPPGDTRGWKLSAARQRMAADRHWQSCVTRCLYRPFDFRFIFWADWMIDWPRWEVMRHMTSGRNIALIARRQMLPTEPCRYFWISDTITLDGVIRSDNRGSESVFPLYLYDQAAPGGRDRAVGRRANFHRPLIDAAASAIRLRWQEHSRGDLRTCFGPEDLIHYVYALFHSTEYRTRYADWLRVDFPRVFLVRDRRLFRTLCGLGETLTGLHLLRAAREAAPSGAPQEAGAVGEGPASASNSATAVVAPGYPKYAGGEVWTDPTCRIARVGPDGWGYYVGGHQVCKKWLKDRRGRALSGGEIAHYRSMVRAVERTIRIVRQIDRAIQRSGGWPGVVADSRIDSPSETSDDGGQR